MKNLKKVLALVLAFAMAFTMMATAGAAYTDQADIEATEAVDTLTALGVMSGDGDGTFRPNDTVTRAEMCRMIYTIRSGGNSDASSFAGMQTTFTDVSDDAWYAGYVKYCQSVGIVSGKSSTIFDPNANVTGVEAALMCLRVMGYDPEKANIGGSTWSTTTIGLATEAGLLDDFNATVTGDCPRQYAAQLMYNMLNADTVTWSEDANGYVKDTAWSTGSTTLITYITVGEKYMNLIKVTGTLLASGKVGLEGSGSEEALVLDEDSLSTADANKAYSFSDVTTDYSDMIGQTVQVLYKEKNSKNTVYGVFSTDDNKVLIETTADVLDVVDNETKIEVDGTKYSVNTTDGLDIYTATVESGSAVINHTYDSIKTASDIATAVEALNINGNNITVISNDGDSKIDTIIVFDKTFAQLTAVTSSSVSYKAVDVSTLKGDVTGSAVKLDLEDDAPVIYDGYEKDDYVFVSAGLYDDVVVIDQAETITSSASAVKDDSIRLDGTWYTFANNGTFSADASKTYTAYVYNGFVYYLDGSSAGSIDDVILVKTVGDFSTLDDAGEVKALFADGTEKVITVTEVDGTTLTSTNWNSDKPQPDTMYTYEQDGSDYELTTVDEDYTENDLSVDKVDSSSSSTTLLYNSSKETINNNSIDDGATIFIKYGKNSTSYKVVTGADMYVYGDLSMVKSSSTLSSYVVTDEDGYVQAAFLNLAGAALKNTDTLYGMIQSVYKAQNADGDTVVYLDLLTADGLQEGVETAETSTSGLNKGDIVSFTGSYTQANDDLDVVSDDVGADQNYAAIKSYNTSSGLVTFYTGMYDAATDGSAVADVQSGKITSDTKVIYVDQSGSTYTSEDGTPTKADELDSENGYYANAFAIVEDDELSLLVIEINNLIKNDDGNTIELYSGTTNTVSSIALTVDAPAYGETPATTASASTGVTVTDVTWTPTVSGTFAEDTAYTVAITVEAASGYAISSSATATVNGETATYSDGVIEYTFDATDKLISDISLTLDTPTVSSSLPTASNNSGTGYTVDSTSWEESSDGSSGWSETSSNAQSTYYYRATITLTAEDGYVFDDSYTVSISGYTVSVDVAEDGATATVTATTESAVS